MRLDPVTLDALRDTALRDVAHPVDVIRLVREVRELNDRIRTLEKTVALPDTARTDERRTQVLWLCEADVMHAALSFLTGAPDQPYQLRLVGSDPELQREWVVVRVTHDVFRRAFGFLIAHPSFPVVPDGMPSPDMASTLQWEFHPVETPVHTPNEAKDDDTGEFVADPDISYGVADIRDCAPDPERAEIVATTSNDSGQWSKPTVTDYQGRRLVFAHGETPDGSNVVVTDCGVMRYDPPVVTGAHQPATGPVPQATARYTPEDMRCSDVAACAAINEQREREGGVRPISTPPSTGYANSTDTYVPQWDWEPSDPGVELVDDGSKDHPAAPWPKPTSLTNLAIPDLLGLLQEPTPLSCSMCEGVITELARRGYKLGGGKQPAPCPPATVSSKVPDGDAPIVVET